MPEFATSRLENTEQAPKTERGLLGFLYGQVAYDGEDTAASITADTINLGAGSVSFHVHNELDVDILCKVHGSNDGNVDSEVELPFMDEVATETPGATGLTIVAGGRAFIILSYATYPEALALRNFRLECTPDGAAVGNITVHLACK